MITSTDENTIVAAHYITSSEDHPREEDPKRMMMMNRIKTSGMECIPCSCCCCSSYVNRRMDSGNEEGGRRNGNWWRKKLKKNYKTSTTTTITANIKSKGDYYNDDVHADYCDYHNEIPDRCFPCKLLESEATLVPSTSALPTTLTSSSEAFSAKLDFVVSKRVSNQNLLNCDLDYDSNQFKLSHSPQFLQAVKKYLSRSSSFLHTINKILVTSFIILLLLLASSCPNANAFPTNDCDWSGSGTPENVVQAVYLRCHEGQIVWERPRGGLRVSISPRKYFKTLGRSAADQPFRLCLESSGGSSNFQVFLEQPDTLTGEGEIREERRKLLPFIDAKKKSSTCYRISTPTAMLYVESQSQPEGEVPISSDNVSSSKDLHLVKIAYEVEELKEERQERASDDECRPCTDQEVLQFYCVADVVAQGEILSVRQSTTRRDMDTIHIKSRLLIHQNYPVFKPLKAGNKNLQKFLLEETPSFDEEAPKKPSKFGKSALGGVISHPSKCAAQSGPGEFLWLIKLSFGRPKVGCVLYWDRWVKIRKEAKASGSADCPLGSD